MESTVLLVEGSTGLANVIRKHLEPARWRIESHATAESALAWLEDHGPQLVIVDVDIARGWNVCVQIKKVMPGMPVIIVSRRFGREVFVEHQKLETRADAYHQLPQDDAAFGITLGLYASRRPPGASDASQSGFRIVTRQRIHSTQSRGMGLPPTPPLTPHPVPGAGGLDMFERLEQKAAAQAREVERLKQLVAALEVERDAVKENAHRQAMQLMSLQSSTDASAAKELLLLKQRVAQLESEAMAIASRAAESNEQVLVALRAERDELARRLGAESAARQQLVDAARTRETEARSTEGVMSQRVADLQREFESRELAWRAERASLQKQLNMLGDNPGEDTVQVSTDYLDRAREDAHQQASEAADQLARASGQLSQLATELTSTHRDKLELQQEKARLEAALEAASVNAVSLSEKLALETKLTAALTRADTAETAWSGLNARFEQTQRLVNERNRDIEEMTAARRDTENALATSRKLMREYAAEAGRKAEELRDVEQRLRELEVEVTTLRVTADDATRERDFQRSLVAMLETDLSQLKTTPPPPPSADLAIEEKARQLETQLVTARDEAFRMRTFLDNAQTSLEALIERVAIDFETAAGALHSVTLALVGAVEAPPAEAPPAEAPPAEAPPAE